MKRIALVSVVALSLVASASRVRAGDVWGPGYAWSISASASTAGYNTPPPVNGLVTFYLWFNATCGLSRGVEVDVVSAEFGLVGDGLDILVVFGQNGFSAEWNAGTVTVSTGGECFPRNPWPTVAAAMLVVGQGGTPQTICFGPSVNGLNVTRACDGLCHDHNWSGLAADGTTPCEFRDWWGWGPNCPPAPGRSRGEAPLGPPGGERGTPCTPVAVDEGWKTGSWGRIKSQYQ